MAGGSRWASNPGETTVKSITEILLQQCKNVEIILGTTYLIKECSKPDRLKGLQIEAWFLFYFKKIK